MRFQVPRSRSRKDRSCFRRRHDGRDASGMGEEAMTACVDSFSFLANKPLRRIPSDRTETEATTLSATPPKWLEAVDQRLRSLGSLRENWDLYGARPIDPALITVARS